jgi:hypothetical protein
MDGLDVPGHAGLILGETLHVTELHRLPHYPLIQAL